jgi:hypothetical protein
MRRLQVGGGSSWQIWRRVRNFHKTLANWLRGSRRLLFSSARYLALRIHVLCSTHFFPLFSLSSSGLS